MHCVLGCPPLAAPGEPLVAVDGLDGLDRGDLLGGEAGVGDAAAYIVAPFVFRVTG